MTAKPAREPLVVFTPSGKRGHIAVDTTVLSAARQLGVDLDSVCGGRGICTRCQVNVAHGSFPKHGITVAPDALSARNPVEDRAQARRGLAATRRLGCQARIKGDVVIDVPPESQVHRQVVRKSASARKFTMDPAVRLYFVEVDEPDMQEPSGDWERLQRALATQWEIAGAQLAIGLFPKLQSTLRKGGWRATLAIFCDHREQPPLIVDLWPGLFTGPLYGLAIDLGSTTIAGHLCDLTSGEVCASSGLMNPQIRFGEDLMSRVSYSMLNPDGTNDMMHAVRGALNQLAASLVCKADIDPTLIVEMTLVGNPVMVHLLLGVDPTELGQAPFALAMSSSITLPAVALDLTSVNAHAHTYILPAIAGHVGADCAAVILSERPDEAQETTLVVDVGTNAEIVLGCKGQVLACSSPTGPAFEGAQISAGQRAAPGAIERVRIDPVSKEPRFRVIGCDLWSDEDGFAAAVAETGVTGICGSGIMEVIAEMRIAGILDAAGRIGPPEMTGTHRCVASGRVFDYHLFDGVKGQNSPIVVTQGDVRAIQLAKSALHAGARLLMDAMGVEHVDAVVLAGAFGAHISPLHALVLGMIPDVPPEKVRSAGNAAGTGALFTLCNRAARARVEGIVHRVTKIETATEQRFQEHFVAANAIPHAHDAYALLAREVVLPQPDFNTRVSPRRRSRSRTTRE